MSRALRHVLLLVTLLLASQWLVANHVHDASLADSDHCNLCQAHWNGKAAAPAPAIAPIPRVVMHVPDAITVTAPVLTLRATPIRGPPALS